MPYTDHSELERAPIVTDDMCRHHVRIESLRHLAGITYYSSRTGRSIAVQFQGAAVLGAVNPPSRSPRAYIDRSTILPDSTEWNLVCLATHALRSWHLKQVIRHQYQELIVACRPYRATHGPVLRTVAQTMRGRFGADWGADERALRTARDTLRRFGVTEV